VHRDIKLRPTALSTEKTTQPDVIQTIYSYYAKEVFDRDANDLAGLFVTTAGAATKERRSAETHGLRRVTQADLPLSFLPHSDIQAATERPVPDPVPTPIVIVDELDPVTPRHLYRAPRVGKVYGGKDMISEDLLDATDSDHDPSDKSDSLKMPEGFGYLSEGDPDFQGVLKFVMPRQLQTKRHMLKNGSGDNEEEEESAVPISGLGESEMPQEGYPFDPLGDKSAREILKNLPPGEQPSLMNGKELAKDIPADVLTRDDFSSGTRNVRRNDPPEEAAVVGEKRSGGKSTSPLGQQSTFDKLMQGTPFTTVVQEDPDVEPILYAPMKGRANHIRDQAPDSWTIHDRQKYHQIELQALLGGPMPADIQLVVGELGSQSRDSWSRAVIRQVFRPVPRLRFHSVIFQRKRLLGRTSYPTFLDMGPSNPESLELQSLQMARISVAQRELHFGNLLARLGQVLMTPAHYRLLGARIVVLLQDISELPFLPVCSRPETDTLEEATRLEVEYGLALIEYMLEIAHGCYNNMISLEGKTNKTTILFVEFWWWLHRKAGYLLRTDLGKQENYPKVPGSSLVSFRRILRDATDWSGRLLFNHLAYAAMRCTDQGIISLGQLLF
jgi:hypothetical protein